MADIKDLQRLIAEKAAKKLIADLEELSKLMDKQPLLKHDKITGNYPPEIFLEAFPKKDPVKYEKTRVDLLFYINPYTHLLNSESYMGQLYKFWLPTYIQNESTEFLKSVDELKDKVDELFDIKADRSEIGGC